LPSLRSWGVAARPAMLENRGGKSHLSDYFVIRAGYAYLSYYRKCRAYNSLHFVISYIYVSRTDNEIITDFPESEDHDEQISEINEFLFWQTPDDLDDDDFNYETIDVTKKRKEQKC
jgi:hypothetical protein